MVNVQDIEMAVSSLPESEYSQFRQWFLNQDWRKWDHQIEDDSEAGRLDFLLDEAVEAKKNKKLKAL